MTSARPGGIAGRAARVATRSRPRRSHHRPTASPVSTEWCTRSRSYSGPRPSSKRRQGRDGPGQTHEPCPFGQVFEQRNLALSPVQLRGDGLCRRGHLLARGGIARQEALRQAHTSDIERDRPNVAQGGRDDLGRTPADVHDDRRPRNGRQTCHGPTVRKAPLFFTAQELGLDAGDLRRRRQGTRWPLAASRTAEVATRRASRTPSRSMSPRNSRNAVEWCARWSPPVAVGFGPPPGPAA